MQGLPRGKIVRDRYIIEDLLGQGGFGAVYRVRDRRVKGNVFALKEIASLERRQRENFLFEWEVLRRLDHPALPRVYRIFEDLPVTGGSTETVAHIPSSPPPRGCLRRVSRPSLLPIAAPSIYFCACGPFVIYCHSPQRYRF